MLTTVYGEQCNSCGGYDEPNTHDGDCPFNPTTMVRVAPTILSVAPHREGGLLVKARYACNHVQDCWFPHAPRRASRQQLKGWVFGSRQQDELCSRCEREAREATQ